MLNLYTTLFLGIPIIGIAFYFSLLYQLRKLGNANGLALPYFINFAAYGTLILFVVSAFFNEWSGMHTVAIIGLSIFGLPATIIYAFKLFHKKSLSKFHYVSFLLNAFFPLAFIIFLAGFSLAFHA